MNTITIIIPVVIPVARFRIQQISLCQRKTKVWKMSTPKITKKSFKIKRYNNYCCILPGQQQWG